MNIVHYCSSLLIKLELKVYRHGKLKLYIKLIRSNLYSLYVFIEYCHIVLLKRVNWYDLFLKISSKLNKYYLERKANDPSKHTSLAVMYIPYVMDIPSIYKTRSLMMSNKKRILLLIDKAKVNWNNGALDVGEGCDWFAQSLKLATFYCNI